ncbi:MAG: hypothetical protein AAGD38_07455 [Acidobacteriota bacterium]
MKRLSIASVLTLLLFAGLVFADDTTTAEEPLPSGLNRLQSWQGVAGAESFELGTLAVNDWLPDRELTRVLVDGDDTKMVLSEERFVLEGTSRFTLREVDTGWWLELTAFTGMAVDSVAEAGDPGMIAARFTQLIAEDYEGRLTLRAQGVPLIEVKQRLWRDDAYQQFTARLVALGESQPLVAAIPVASRVQLQRLASLVRTGDAGPDLDRFANVIITLASLVERDPTAAPTTPPATFTWRLLEADYQNSPDLDSRNQRLVETFAVSPADPLEDLRAAASPTTR